MTFAQLTTKGGYNCAEVSSALQKCIRRGLEEQALFWATELDIAGFGEYVWKRLRIIASEDVGLADSAVASTILALYQNWREQAKKKDVRHAPERLFLVHAVLILCRAPKSRTVDHALIAMYEAPRHGQSGSDQREIPDFALDRHTAAGRKLKRGWRHFWAHGAILENKAPVNDPYEATARAIRRDRQENFDFNGGDT
jgi:replication-associated recombination protein RarA